MRFIINYQQEGQRSIWTGIFCSGEQLTICESFLLFVDRRYEGVIEILCTGEKVGEFDDFPTLWSCTNGRPAYLLQLFDGIFLKLRQEFLGAYLRVTDKLNVFEFLGQLPPFANVVLHSLGQFIENQLRNLKDYFKLLLQFFSVFVVGEKDLELLLRESLTLHLSFLQPGVAFVSDDALLLAKHKHKGFDQVRGQCFLLPAFVNLEKEVMVENCNVAFEDEPILDGPDHSLSLLKLILDLLHILHFLKWRRFHSNWHFNLQNSLFGVEIHLAFLQHRLQIVFYTLNCVSEACLNFFFACKKLQCKDFLPGDAVLGVALKHGLEQFPECGSDELVGKVNFVFLGLADEFFEALGLEGHSAVEHLEEDHSHGPYIAFVGVGTAEQYFWADMRGGQPFMQSLVNILNICKLLVVLREAEVSDLVPFLAEEDVGRLEMAVDDRQIEQALVACNQLPHNDDCLCLREGFPLQKNILQSVTAQLLEDVYVSYRVFYTINLDQVLASDVCQCHCHTGEVFAYFCLALFFEFIFGDHLSSDQFFVFCVNPLENITKESFADSLLDFDDKRIYELAYNLFFLYELGEQHFFLLFYVFHILINII